MIFNNVWTKEKNDKLRQFIKEKKSTDFIIEYFCEDLEHHPTKKYSHSVLKGYHLQSYKQFNEIKINPINTLYDRYSEYSEYYENKENYIINFVDNDTKYIIMLLYVENFNKPSYEIVFTTQKQYDIYIKTINDIKKKRILNLTDEELLTDIIEKETNYNKVISIMKKLSYIILREIKLLDIPLSLTETNNYKKIELYRNIIKDSFDIVETSGMSELNPGKKIFYYELK